MSALLLDLLMDVAYHPPARNLPPRCPVCGLRTLLVSINFPRFFGDLKGATADTCGRCRGWASRLFDEFVVRKRDSQRPPPVCPDCGAPALKGTTSEGYYCSASCGWFGTLDAFCDCCDRRMEATGPIEAYGIETYACSVCRNPEY